MEMVDALRHFSAGIPPEKMFFWIDIFAVSSVPKKRLRHIEACVSNFLIPCHVKSII
jgi:hypothetical protein